MVASSTPRKATARSPFPIGTTASGISLLAGLVTLDDLRSGSIDHTLSIGVATTRAAAVSWPANRTDGKSDAPGALPEGQRLRLDPSIDLDTLQLTPLGRMIAEALQRYGAIVRDTTVGSVTLYAENPLPMMTGGQVDPYHAFYGSTPKYALLDGIPWDRLHALPADYGARLRERTTASHSDRCTEVNTILVVAAAVVAVTAGAAIGLFLRPAVFFSLGVGASVLSGNWDRLGLPIGIDRLLVLAGLGALVLGITVSPRPEGRRKFRTVEVAMVLLATVAIASAIVAGSLTSSEGIYSLLDRLGIIPFLAFAMADRVFGTKADRRFLVGTMVAVGAYLALTSIFEIVGVTALVFPKYINNPLVGTHLGPGRGPFLEAGANGLALFECGVAAAVGLRVFRRRQWRVVSAVVIGLCALGVLLTLTRADWIAAVAGAAVGCLLHPRVSLVGALGPDGGAGRRVGVGRDPRPRHQGFGPRVGREAGLGSEEHRRDRHSNGRSPPTVRGGVEPIRCRERRLRPASGRLSPQ